MLRDSVERPRSLRRYNACVDHSSGVSSATFAGEVDTAVPGGLHAPHFQLETLITASAVAGLIEYGRRWSVVQLELSSRNLALSTASPRRLPAYGGSR